MTLTDEPLTEYAVSTLSPVPLPPLATHADFLALGVEFACLKADIERLESAAKDDFPRLKGNFELLETATKEDIWRLKAQFLHLEAITKENVRRPNAVTKDDFRQLENNFVRLRNDFLRLESTAHHEDRRLEHRRQLRWLIGICATAWCAAAAVLMQVILNAIG